MGNHTIEDDDIGLGTDLTLSEDGTRWLYAKGSKLRVMDVTSDAERAKFPVEGQVLGAIVREPWVFATTFDGTASRLMIGHMDRGPLTSWTPDSGDLGTEIAASRDGTTLAIATWGDGRIFVLNLTLP